MAFYQEASQKINILHERGMIICIILKNLKNYIE